MQDEPITSQIKHNAHLQNMRVSMKIHQQRHENPSESHPLSASASKNRNCTRSTAMGGSDRVNMSFSRMTTVAPARHGVTPSRDTNDDDLLPTAAPCSKGAPFTRNGFLCAAVVQFGTIFDVANAEAAAKNALKPSADSASVMWVINMLVINMWVMMKLWSVTFGLVSGAEMRAKHRFWSEFEKSLKVIPDSIH